MKNLFDRIGGALFSLGLSCTLLLLLGLLTWLGTLEQVHSGLFEVQKKYFESFYLWHDFGPFSIPLPGANLVMSVLFVNLVLGGIVRIRKGMATAGVMITHVGILMLLGAGFVKAYYSADGHVTLYEGQASDTFQSYYRWELAVLEDMGDGHLRERVVPHERLAAAEGSQGSWFSTPELPFRLAVSGWMDNCEPLPKGPMFEVPVPVVEGVFLKQLPPEKDAEWSDRGVEGAYRFLGRVWRMVEKIQNSPRAYRPVGPEAKIPGPPFAKAVKGKTQNEKETEAGKSLKKKIHQTIKKVTDDLDEGFHFNTAISSIMELVNETYNCISIAKDNNAAVLKETAESVIVLLAPFVPHITEEMWQNIGKPKSIFKSKWPSYDKKAIVEEIVTIPIQINGKLRSKVKVPFDIEEGALKTKVLSDPKVKDWIGDKPIKKFIVVPKKLANIVV